MTLSFVPTRVVLKCKPYIHHHHLFVPLMSVQSALERLWARTIRQDNRCIGVRLQTDHQARAAPVGVAAQQVCLIYSPRRRISCPWHPRFAQRVTSNTRRQSIWATREIKQSASRAPLLIRAIAPWAVGVHPFGVKGRPSPLQVVSTNPPISPSYQQRVCHYVDMSKLPLSLPVMAPSCPVHHLRHRLHTASVDPPRGRLRQHYLALMSTLEPDGG
jgi:hypothetical protein